jgi:hypothetical protein
VASFKRGLIPVASAARRVRRTPAAKGIYFANLGLVLLVGVLFCAWVLYFSGWFEVVGGLLALGGAFSWLAFVSKILRQDRLLDFQDWVENRILGQRIMVIVFSVCLCAEFLVALLFVGTIQVESFQQQSDRALYVYRVGCKPAEAIRLTPGASQRFVLPTTWWQPVEYVVKVSGYPDLVERLLPFHRELLRIPSSFRRSIVLIRPTPTLANMIGHDEQRLSISVTRITGTTLTVGEHMHYTGQAIWIGCDDDTEVPQAIQDRWSYQLGADQRLAAYWRRPETLGDNRLELSPGDEVQAELRDQSGNSKSTVAVRIQLPQRREEFVIEEVLP